MSHCDVLDLWNPASDAYSDKYFNVYDTGVGRDICAQQDETSADAGQERRVTRDPKEKRPIKLYITGVPRRCTTASLEEMFSEYGTVLEISRANDHVRKDLSRLWVTYESFRNANVAMENLNGKKIDNANALHFEVAISEMERLRRKEEKEGKFHAYWQEATVSPDNRKNSLYAVSDQPSQPSPLSISCPPVANANPLYSARMVPRAVLRSKPASSSAPPVTLSNTIPMRSLQIGSEGDFILKCVSNPKNFSVVVPLMDELSKYRQLEENILSKSGELMGGLGKMEVATVPRGSAMLALYQGKLHRALLAATFAEEKKVQVWLVDDGNMVVVNFQDLIDLPKEMTKLPALCIRCALRGIRALETDGAWSPEATMLMRDFVNASVVLRCHEVDHSEVPIRHSVDVVIDEMNVAQKLRTAGFVENLEEFQSVSIDENNIHLRKELQGTLKEIKALKKLNKNLGDELKNLTAEYNMKSEKLHLLKTFFDS